eukprot:scaffold790_cov387-Prasinococcus_capsulatus_cf.AAC.15
MSRCRARDGAPERRGSPRVAGPRRVQGGSVSARGWPLPRKDGARSLRRRGAESRCVWARMAAQPPTSALVPDAQGEEAVAEQEPAKTKSLAANGDGLVREGMFVILETNGETSSFVRVKPDGQVKVAKHLVSMGPLVGARFGTLFELAWSEGRPCLVPNKVRASSLAAGATEQEVEAQGAEDAMGAPKMKASDYAHVEGGSNKTFFDDNTAQKLDDKAIWELREKGVEGKEIVEALIANSATFGEKSAFAQEKYRKKMMKRHTVKVLLRRPTARSICEVYFAKKPYSICGLRVDTFSQLMCLGNIAAGGRVLLVDGAGGLLIGAAAEKMAGLGICCSTYPGTRAPSASTAQLFNLSCDQARPCTRASLMQLHSCAKALSCEARTHFFSMASPLSEHEKNDVNPGDSIPANDENTGEVGLTGDGGDNGEVEKASRLLNRAVDDEELKRILVEGCHEQKGRDGQPTAEDGGQQERKAQDGFFNSVAIAWPQLQPLAIVKAILPLCMSSASFAIFSPTMRPLVDCMHDLQTNRLAINMMLSESWMREYQVLPQRTHPRMTMSGTGGYILSGTTLLRESAAVSGPKRKREE